MCASCFYYGGENRCTWSSRPSTATSSDLSHETPARQSTEGTDNEDSKHQDSPPPKRRRLAKATEVSSSRHYEGIDLAHDSITVRAPKPGSSTSPPASKSESPLPRVFSDLKPQSRSRPQPRKRVSSRPLDAPKSLGTLAAANRQKKTSDCESREDGFKSESRGKDDGWKDERIVDLEQQRNDYQAALQREKAKTEKLGEDLLLLRARVSPTGPDEVQALKEEVEKLRDHLKKKEAALAGDHSNGQEKASETRPSQSGRLVSKDSSGVEEIDRLRKQLSAAQTARAAHVDQLNLVKQQAEEEKKQYDTRTKELGEELAKSTALIEEGKLKLHKAEEEHGHLTNELASLQSFKAEELKFVDRKITTLEQQLRDAKKKLPELEKAVQSHRKAEQGMEQTIQTLNEEVNRRKVAGESAEEQISSLRSSESQLKQQIETITLERAKLQGTIRIKGQEIKDFRTQNKDLRQRLAERDKALEETKETLEETKETLGETKETLEERDQALEEKNKALQKRDKALEERDKALEERNKALQKRDKTLEERNKTLGEIEKALRKRNKTLKETKKTLEETDEKLLALQASKDAIEKEFAEQSRELREREDEARSMTAKIEELETAKENMAIELQECWDERLMVAKEIEEVFGRLAAWIPATPL